VPIKRLHLLLEAIYVAKSVYPAISACVIGEGPLLQQLNELSIRLGLQPNVKFLGYQSDVTSWLRRAKIFMLTSISEGLSLAMMEAMASGLPAIVPAIGDLEDLVSDNENGYLISDPQPELFARRVLELLTHPDKLSRFSISARTSAENYSIAHAVGQWNCILDSQRYAGCSFASI
jgi:glycosyltransferase involved in cell wall biosynthesis